MKPSLKIIATTLLLSSVLNMPLCGSTHPPTHVTFGGSPVELDPPFARRLASSKADLVNFASQQRSNKLAADFIRYSPHY